MPILNVRLVRGPGSYGVSDKFGPRKGRSATRGRMGAFSDYTESDVLEHGGNSASCNAVGDDSGRDIGQSSQESVPEHSENEGANSLTADVVLQDVGKITCSWGD